MEENLNQVAGMVGNLQNMAVGMGDEIRSQNKLLDRVAQKVRVRACVCVRNLYLRSLLVHAHMCVLCTHLVVVSHRRNKTKWSSRMLRSGQRRSLGMSVVLSLCLSCGMHH